MTTTIQVSPGRFSSKFNDAVDYVPIADSTTNYVSSRELQLKEDELTEVTAAVSSDDTLMNLSSEETAYMEETGDSITWCASDEGSETSVDSCLRKGSGSLDTAILDDMVDIVLVLGINEQETFIYYCASTICITRFFAPVEILLAVIVVLFVKRESSTKIDQFIARIFRRLQPVLAKFDAIGIVSSEKMNRIESKLKSIEVENMALRKKLESEKWMVKNLRHSLSRKDTILESEINNRAAVEQSNELVQALHDYEKSQLIETAKRLEDEIRVQAETMAFLEKQAQQRDLLLANIVDNFERSGINVSKREMKSDKYSSTNVTRRSDTEEMKESTRGACPQMTDAQ